MSTNAPTELPASPAWTVSGGDKNSGFGGPLAPGAGSEGLSQGLHDALVLWSKGAEFEGILTAVWGLYTPLYLGPGDMLPAIASNGQEAYCLVNSANSIVWKFVYFGANATTGQGTGVTGFPWIFMGGSPMRADVFTNETCSSASFVDLATVGPSIVAPFSGDYNIGFSVQPNNFNTPNANAGAAAFTGTTQCAPALNLNTTANTMNETVTQKAPSLATTKAGDTLKLKYSISPGTCQFANRWIEVLPIRVAGQ